MVTLSPHDKLVADLAEGLKPVRPLPAPGVRAVFWFGGAMLVGLILATRMDAGDLLIRMRAPNLMLAALGAMSTAVTAALSAFATAVPGRSGAWALLPLPAVVLWIGASGLGCLYGRIVPGTGISGPHDMRMCLGVLVCVSVPLSALMVVMVRRACPLRPNLTAALGGLAVAAVAATMLMPFHPYDATATDLALHAAVLLGVIGLNRILAGPLLAGRS
ncbi:NrsF family protein [Methylobacterium radiotolerans]|uniref:NrsF family protein n=1 Tax=Methylobacterium radiotolerans TaxID=31998 RepID=UPI0038D241C9